MKCLNIEEKIKKSIKFITKKFNKAIIEVKIIGEDSRYIEINNGKYNMLNSFNDKCDGILILQNGKNNFYEFKEILKKIPEYFSGNGVVFLRYENNSYDSIEDIENKFMTYLKLNKFKDIEEYILLSDSDESGIFIVAKYHMELLYKENEYEIYTQNFVRPKKKSGQCGECKSKEGCNSEMICKCLKNCSCCDKAKGQK